MELKECPYCGGKNLHVDISEDTHVIICLRCGSIISGEKEDVEENIACRPFTNFFGN
jgi:DNA-directed RNA polymerase subunit RPC12/RpoP